MPGKHTATVLEKKESHDPQIIMPHSWARQEKGKRRNEITRINALLGEAEQRIKELDAILARFGEVPSPHYQAHPLFRGITTELPEIIRRAEALCLASCALCLRAVETVLKTRKIEKTRPL